MKILAIDTTAAAASCAICEDDFLLAEYYVNLKQTHSQTIMPMIENTLNLSKIKLDDIDLFAVSTGPGSFTGVRIGVAAIKGLALPKDKPCSNVSSLEALAYNVCQSDCMICCVMDARRNQFYNAIFEYSNNQLQRITEDRAIAFENLEKEINNAVLNEKKIILVGDGANLCYNNLKDKYSKFVILASQNLRYAKASSVAEVALKQFNNGNTITSSELLPSYLRLPQAERELKKRNSNEIAKSDLIVD